MRKLLFSAALVFAAGPVMAEEWPDLPVGVKNGIAARVGERLIVGLGSAGTELFSLDLTNREAGWQRLPDFPGPAPSMPAAAASGDDLYVFSGSGKLHEDDASPIIFDTGWKLGPNGWQQLGSTTPAGLLGASALSLPDDRIAVIGGYNKKIFDSYLADITAVNKDDDPETWNKIVNSYMAMKPEDYRWNDLVLIYDPAGDNWSDLGADPSLPNTGSAVVRTKPGTFSIINGEVKPGLRTDQVKTLQITDGTATWGSLPPVPAPEGANIQDGLAGAFAGLVDDAILLAGGANFPGARSNADGGNWYAHKGLTKTWNDEIYALRNGAWSQVGKLTHGLAYGGSFSLDEGLLIVGGEDSEGKARSDVFVLALQNDELTRID